MYNLLKVGVNCVVSLVHSFLLMPLKIQFWFPFFQIIVLESGKVVEQGPHEVLLSRAGRYAQLWAQQNNSDAVEAEVRVQS